MLRLLDTPHWSAAGGRYELPNTLPGWTIAFLVVQGDWVARDRLLTLLWPDAGATEAQHNLRVNLHRVRGVLAGWGQAEVLETERMRVRLRLDSDVAELRRVLESTDAGDGLSIYRRPLLASMSFPGFPAFQEWVELERAALHARWREAVLSDLDSERGSPALTIERSQALLATDPLDEEAMAHLVRGLHSLGRDAEALRHCDTFRARLRQELGVEPSPPLQALVATLTAATATPPLVPTSARDAFLGRDIELGQIASMLTEAQGRMVTLVGPGGVGKSRTARELTQRLASRWNDGVIWVPLGDLSSAVDLWPRLAERLDLVLVSTLEPQVQVTRALAGRHMLIALDNAEHLDDLPALLAALQRTAPRVSWLITSRSPLALSGERTYTLEGLDRPQAGDAPCNVEEARSFDAVRLLEARTRAINPEFDLASHWPECLELIQTVGGWPLAIELAAGALAQHDARAVLSDLTQSIDTLASGQAPKQARHDSVRASLDLSWQLLGASERRALARLAVFRGGFTRIAGLAVIESSGAVLAILVERSLVQVAGNGRFALHPLVAQFSSEKLVTDAAEHDRSTLLYAEYFVRRLLACAEVDSEGAGAMLKEIEADFENFRAAWNSLIARADATRLGRCARVWSEFGTAKGRARDIAQFIAAAIPATPPDTAARSALLQAAANLRFRAGELDLAQALARDGLHAAAAAGDEVGRRALLNTLALALKDLGRYDEAEIHAQDGLQRARGEGSEREVASHANTCAILAKTRGDFALAAALYEEATAIHRRSANHRSLTMCLNNLGNVLRANGDWNAAQRSFEESLRLADQYGFASTRAFALVNLAIVHFQSGRAALAQSFALRARAEPAAEIGVLLAVHAVMILTAIALSEFDRAQDELQSLAKRARETGHHAALLETVGCHAKLLAALGRRGDALARLVFVIEHPLTPAMQRSDVQEALQRLNPTAEERSLAQKMARGFDLDSLIQDAATGTVPPVHRA